MRFGIRHRLPSLTRLLVASAGSAGSEQAARDAGGVVQVSRDEEAGGVGRQARGRGRRGADAIH